MDGLLSRNEGAGSGGMFFAWKTARSQRLSGKSKCPREGARFIRADETHLKHKT
jgi:hypothetical protein